MGADLPAQKHRIAGSQGRIASDPAGVDGRRSDASLTRVGVSLVMPQGCLIGSNNRDVRLHLEYDIAI
jgi:hypothetical protein